MKKCCFLSCNSINQSKIESAINKVVVNIQNIIDDEYTYFISSFCPGFDLLFACAILKLKEKNNNIIIEAAIAYKNMFLNDKNISMFIDKADIKTEVSSKYTKTCFITRDRYMIDEADFVIILKDSLQSSRVYNAIKYANSKAKKHIIIEI